MGGNAGVLAGISTSVSEVLHLDVVEGWGPSTTYAAVNELIEHKISEARESLSATVDKSLAKARKSGRVSDFERIHEAIIRARQSLK